MAYIDTRTGLRFMVYHIAAGAQGYAVIDQRENKIIWGPGSKADAQHHAALANDSLAK